MYVCAQACKAVMRKGTLLDERNMLEWFKAKQMKRAKELLLFELYVQVFKEMPPGLC